MPGQRIICYALGTLCRPHWAHRIASTTKIPLIHQQCPSNCINSYEMSLVFHWLHPRLKQVLRSIVAVNENPAVHGLIVQLPLDSVHPMDTEKVTNAVAPEKDVDGWVALTEVFHKAYFLSSHLLFSFKCRLDCKQFGYSNTKPLHKGGLVD